MFLDEYHRNLLKVAAATPGRGGYSSASSAQHLKRALELKEKMPEVAVFLTITAEEEAATAVFSALRKKRYKEAERLRDKVHAFKAGLYPFIQLLGNTVAAIQSGVTVQLFFEPKQDQTDDAILRIRVPMNVPGREDLFLFPNPPLNLVSVDPGGKKTDYFEAVRKVATEKGIDSIFEQTRKWANRRNRMLYASDSGIPKVKDVEKWMLPHFKGVFANLAAYLLVEQHPKQNFVQEALTAYLKIQSRLEARER